MKKGAKMPKKPEEKEFKAEEKIADVENTDDWIEDEELEDLE